MSELENVPEWVRVSFDISEAYRGEPLSSRQTYYALSWDGYQIDTILKDEAQGIINLLNRLEAAERVVESAKGADCCGKGECPLCRAIQEHKRLKESSDE